MSTYTHVEQTTPTTPTAGQQVIYGKSDGVYFMQSDGIEKKLQDSRGLPLMLTAQYAVINGIGGF